MTAYVCDGGCARFTTRWCGLIALASLAAAGCGSAEDSVGDVGASEMGAPPAEAEEPYEGRPLSADNPFEGFPLYVFPDTQAAQAAQELESPEEAALANKIASQPAAEWFDQPIEAMRQAVRAYVSAAASEGALPVLIPYNIPARDCGQYSAGGVEGPQVYRDWMDVFIASIGDRPAVVVLEPDALPLVEECLSEQDQGLRFELFQYALEGLAALPNTAAYIDAGHSSWISVEVMAERLRASGIANARGFSLNVSNYQRDEDLVGYGQQLIEALGSDVHFVVDSSRNGNGPATGEESWCNPTGRALGRMPVAVTDEPGLDAYLWIKRPGESDGECKGGPAPGRWFPERAFELARGADW